MNHWDLIAKKLTEGLSSEEEKNLELWIVESPENKKEYEQALKTWNLVDENIDFDPNTEKAWEKLESKIRETKVVPLNSKNSSKSTYRTMGYAAAALLAIIGLTFVFNVLTKPEITTYTASDSVKEISLSDGTKVWLNANSSLEINNYFNETKRDVKLNGEAYFEVAHNKEKPFKISTEYTKTTVLGTSFYIGNSSGDSKEYISVNSGKVKYQFGANEVILTKGEKAKIDSKGNVEKTSLNNPNEFAVKSGKLQYENVTLQQIFSDIKKFNHYIVESESSIDTCLFTGQFETLNPKEILETLVITNNIQYHFNDNIISVSGEGCK